MRTNIELDESLVAEAQRLTGIATKRELVDEALRLLVASRRRQPLASLRGRVRLDDAYDHREAREREPGAR
ncbi:MAG: type II toxin-antitoxin system VapB family antitoxin [Deltaproteobacteria bacterium]|nr:type II toxin-antitoxin system VapB family antitoxin [Deltaproteobacteria bacterium]